ncbi:VOC family protein [Marinobacter sp.]|uniref:VOC family protein n=1 Tax=Marinobacter sp. TaxID=50741 RepID=UPI0034A5708B
MHYLHTMIRVSNLDETLHFFCDLLEMNGPQWETRRLSARILKTWNAKTFNQG